MHHSKNAEGDNDRLSTPGNDDRLSAAGNDDRLSVDSNEVYWTAQDIVGLFVDSVGRGEPPDAQVVRYVPDEAGNILAEIREKKTGRTRFYEMDIASGKPKPVRALRLVR